MSIKSNRKGTVSKKMICVASMIGLGAFYLFGKDYLSIKETTSSIKIESLLTMQTLETYNSYLAQAGSLKRLTEEDLAKIEAINETDDKTIAIQIDDFEINEVKTKSYQVCENENGELELGFIDPKFKSNYFKSSCEQESMTNSTRTVLNPLGTFIEENDIEPMGYTNSFPVWDEEKVNFVIQHYGEDVLDCFQEYGFPVFLYDVNAFYEAHQKYQGVAR